MQPISTTDLLSIGAPLITLLGALFLPLTGVFLKVERQHGYARLVTLSVILAAIVFLVALHPTGEGFHGEVILDALSLPASLIVLLLSALLVPAMFSPAFAFRDHPSLIGGLWLSSLTGALLMLISDHLLVVFIALELLSIPLYVLTSLGKGERRGSEAAFKYFILGSIASALFVFGLALLWGELGTLKIAELSKAIFSGMPTDLALLGLGLAATAMLFKIGLAPFHMWAPDVYEVAPSSLVAWMSGVVKLCASAVLLRFSMSDMRGDFSQRWTHLLLALSVLSMFWGALGALFQKNVKRLLAFSSIAHAGYILLGIATGFQGQSDVAVSSFLFYTATYALASVVCFSIVVQQERLGSETLEDYHGLFQRAPLQAILFSIALFSLAGLPPLSGFFAKFRIFSTALDQGHLVVVLLASLSTVVSLGYYLKVVYQLMMEPSKSSSQGVAQRADLSMAFLATVFVLALGIFPFRIFDLVTGFWK